MDCVSPILDIATRLWDCTAKRAVYIRELEENLNSLRGTMEELKNVYKDVKGRVESEEVQNMRRTNEVAGWLGRVETMEEEIKKILAEGEQEVQNKCFGACPKNCRSSYKLGKIASEKINSVNELLNKGRFDVVADRLPPPAVDERPMEETVGLDLYSNKVWEWVEDTEVRIIGIYGSGGVGKTTLLRKINNRFLDTSHNFEAVIWIVVSKPTDVEKVQDRILDKLQLLPNDARQNKSKEDKASTIVKALKEKRFVLLLDDMWDRLDLLEVGIPPLNAPSKSKIIATTRSEKVCIDMEVHKKIKVECLKRDDAWALFRNKVGEKILNFHPDIQKLAEIIVEECKGLPLALITIGRTMASKKTPREWEQAMHVLKDNPAKFSGMGDRIFPILKFSYDSLENDTIKSCFRYCSLFPEDYEIEDEKLIQLWIGEGFLDEYDDIHDARNHGYEMIRSLKFACLLEDVRVDDFYPSKSKMHDIIRDMALWLQLCDDGREEKVEVFVHESSKVIRAQQVSSWKKAQKISLWNCDIDKEVSDMLPRFSNLQTLFLSGSSVGSFPTNFFQFMPSIRVLVLTVYYGSGHQLASEIGKLATLQYLDLSETYITEVPRTWKNLTKLRCLMLNSMYSIPSQVISTLSSLRMFSLFGNTTNAEDVEGNVLLEGNRGLLVELESLPYINDVRIYLSTVSAVHKLLDSSKLQMAIRFLALTSCKGLETLELSSSHLRTMKNLEEIRIYVCDELEGLKIKGENEVGLTGIPSSSFLNLAEVFIHSCPKLLDLTWLIYAPRLERLQVICCQAIEHVIRGDYCGDSENLLIFSRLRHLYLQSLTNLKSICRRALPFPSLVSISVLFCPELKKLPLDSNSATNSLKEIKGAKSWWEGLQWEDQSLQARFHTLFLAGF